MRVAILGFGKVAESTHVPGFQNARRGSFEIVAVAEPTPERRARAAEALPAARIYRDVEELFARERDVELADVAAPPFLHAPLVSAALRARAHVLCEKPLSLDPTEVRTLGELATRQGRVLYTVNNWRHAPLTAEAIRRARELGEVRLFAWSVRRKAADPGAAPAGKTWREDPKLALGGVLVDHGWHAFTVAHGLLGSGPREVRARLRDEAGKGDVEARVWIRQGPARIFVRLTWRAEKRANRGRIVGTDSALRIEDDRLVSSRGPDVSFPEKLSHGSIHPEWFPPVLDALVAEIDGRVPHGTNLSEALYCATTIQAAYDSASRGGVPVRVDGA